MNLNTPTIEKLDPKVWGKSTWEFLDTIVITYPLDNPSQTHRDAVIDLLESLRILLPCPDCRIHYNSFLNANPMGEIIHSRASLLNFYFKLRKEISIRKRQVFKMRNIQELWNHITANVGLWKSTTGPRLNTAATAAAAAAAPHPIKKRFETRGCSCNR